MVDKHVNSHTHKIVFFQKNSRSPHKKRGGASVMHGYGYIETILDNV